MNIKLKGSRHYAVNLLADFLLEKIPRSENTIIQIADCQNFLIIKGKTSYEEPLDLLNLKTEFVEIYKNKIPENFGTHTIDLIEYSSKLESSELFTLELYQTENPIYDKEQIKKIESETEPENDDNLIVVSEFPHGYSLSMNRTLFYYSVFMTSSIPTDFFFGKLKISIPKVFEESNFDVEVSNESNEKLKSFFLDYFDFNYKIFEKKIQTHNFCDEFENQIKLPNFMKEKPKDLIIF